MFPRSQFLNSSGVKKIGLEIESSRVVLFINEYTFLPHSILKVTLYLDIIENGNHTKNEIGEEQRTRQKSLVSQFP